MNLSEPCLWCGTAHMRSIDSQMKGGLYAPGYNVDSGDSFWKIFFKFWEHDQMIIQGRIATVPHGVNWTMLRTKEEAAKRRKENEEAAENGKYGKWL